MDTIIIFQKPELYFFPHYKEMVFAPFSVPERSPRYLVYKLLYLLRLPLCAAFWGGWKRHVAQAKLIVIFDYGYQRGMERYIRRHNPGCRVVVYYWNRVGRYNRIPLQTMAPADLYSTDPADCVTYRMNYQHIFYPREFYTPPVSPEVRRLFFLGADKGRAPFLAALKPVLEKAGLSCDIRVLPSEDGEDYRQRFAGILCAKPLSYPEYLRALEGCSVLLDVNQRGQRALTMRVLESIYLSKKLITGNQDIVTYDFYTPDNIFVLPADGSLPAPDDLRAFVEKPFVPYPDHILDAYSFEHWRAGF